jgi:hypothetical protein
LLKEIIAYTKEDRKYDNIVLAISKSPSIPLSQRGWLNKAPLFDKEGSGEIFRLMSSYL